MHNDPTGDFHLTDTSPWTGEVRHNNANVGIRQATTTQCTLLTTIYSTWEPFRSRALHCTQCDTSVLDVRRGDLVGHI